jgi:hypothetical protein
MMLRCGGKPVLYCCDCANFGELPVRHCGGDVISVEEFKDKPHWKLQAGNVGCLAILQKLRTKLYQIV